MLTTLLALFTTANAASLDLLEVGGLYGSPAATNATATFWNPAALAMEQGTRFNIEGAPTFATVNATIDGQGEYWGGDDQYKYFGVAPFAGIATDFGVKGLGTGLSLNVPFAKGAETVELGGNGRYHLQKANIKSIFITGAASYRFGKVALGASGSLVQSSWTAISTTETLTSLNANLQEALGPVTTYTDDDIYNPNYTTTLNFKNLADRTYSFSAGIYITPSDKLAISVAYLHGGSLSHTGDLGMNFDCPPEEDALGNFGATLTGTCYGEFTGQGTVNYDFPWRTNLGIRWMPTGEPDRFAVELMGAYVNWSVFTDYNIITDVDPDSVDLEDEAARQDTADTVSQNRLWARDNQGTFWVGLDVKRRVMNDKLLLGGRVIYDKAAIPSTTLATSNYDADTVMLSGLAAITIMPGVDLGASFGNYFLAKRTVTDSAFSTTLDSEAAAEPRYFYPSANGTYHTTIQRLAVNLSGSFGKKKTTEAIQSAPSDVNFEPIKAAVEVLPVDEAPAEEAPADEAPAEEAPADEAPADEAPADEAPAEDSILPTPEETADEAPTEEAPAEEAPAEEW